MAGDVERAQDTCDRWTCGCSRGCRVSTVAGKRRIDRQALGASTSAAEVNVVTHPGYTEKVKDRHIAFLNDHEKGSGYVQENLCM